MQQKGQLYVKHIKPINYYTMAKNDKIDLINSLIVKCLEKKKSIMVVQRYLRMKYGIRASMSVLNARIDYLKFFLNNSFEFNS